MSSGLTHLLKLDYSENKLQLLTDFGHLVLNKRLVTLPVRVAQLKNLKWLDLKDNLLKPVLLTVANYCAPQKENQGKEYNALKASMWEQEKEPKKEEHQAPKSKFGSHPSKSPVETHSVLGCAEAAAAALTAVCGQWAICLWRDRSAAATPPPQCEHHSRQCCAGSVLPQDPPWVLHTNSQQ
ncbi:Leucine-rich repeat-containing protein 59 [Sciurus carolinensis]|uniref:Leucine-rich repeat-containing protein 59 n=1 Tax=Sciurus carolinensis TaxID=30640 RepID=A0AA41T3J7_SCICA|nr:Leucine-rich repeat-containing protein 59 [Sciurus carolinensis]